jgi:hypothetical protein
MDNDPVPTTVNELAEIARLREDNEALRESAMLWRRLYERALIRMQQGEADPYDTTSKSPKRS